MHLCEARCQLVGEGCRCLAGVGRECHILFLDGFGGANGGCGDGNDNSVGDGDVWA